MDRDALELMDLDFERCQQWGCERNAETWCPLCRGFFCEHHDSLYPVRMHDCLKGKAEAEEQG